MNKVIANYSLLILLMTQQFIFSQEEIKKSFSFVEEYSIMDKKIDYNEIILWKDYVDTDMVYNLTEFSKIDTSFSLFGVLENVNGVNLPLELQCSVLSTTQNNLDIKIAIQKFYVQNNFIAEKVVLMKQYDQLYSIEEYKIKYKENIDMLNIILNCEMPIVKTSDNSILLDINSEGKFAVSIFNMQGQKVYSEEIESSSIINGNNFRKNELYVIFVKNLHTNELCSKKYIKM